MIIGRSISNIFVFKPIERVKKWQKKSTARGILCTINYNMLKISYHNMSGINCPLNTKIFSNDYAIPGIDIVDVTTMLLSFTQSIHIQALEGFQTSLVTGSHHAVK